MSLRSVIRPLVPRRIRDAHAARSLARTRDEFGAMTLQDSFATIYDRAEWGEGPEGSASGAGSSLQLAQHYVELVNGVVPLEPGTRVVDLGCGDFRVGRQLVDRGIDYVGVDVVPTVVERNTRLHASDHVSFLCRDVTTEAPPVGDVALVRQVLQHLSNDEIVCFLRHCAAFPQVIITEHVPAGTDWEPNADKPHGPDIRLYDGSGIALEAPPFSLPVEELELAPYSEDALGGALRTVVVRGPDLARL